MIARHARAVVRGSQQLDHLKQQPSESSAMQEHGLHRTFDELRLEDMPTLVRTLT